MFKFNAQGEYRPNPPQKMPVDLRSISRGLSKEELRGEILRIESLMDTMEDSKLDLEVVNHFTPGVYARELTIPTGTLLTGKIHRFEHLCVVSKGDISVLSEDGFKRIKAPFTFVSKPGVKRLAYVHEETVWTTFHANPDEVRDPEALVERHTAPNYEALGETEVPVLDGGVL